MQPSSLSVPVVVIGAGPVGLAAAAHLVRRGERPVVFEAGDTVGASIRAWGHVRPFSPWQYVVDSACVAMLEATGWQRPPADELPTGHELVDRYLLSLAALPQIALVLRLRATVVAVTRRGFDKLKTDGRDQAPFAVVIRRADGTEEEVLARAVIDASGTHTAPNPLGASGRPTVGERAVADRVVYGIPDALGRDRDRYAGKRVLVVGSGHSAFNVLSDLAQLALQAPSAAITWANRRTTDGRLYGGGDADALPARGTLGRRMQGLAATGQIRLERGFRVAALRRDSEQVAVVAEDGRTLVVDEVVATTGFRPDLSLTGELRLALDPVVAALVGDLEAARTVMLTLPETGVCSGPGAGGDDAASCCATTPALAPAPALVDLLTIDPLTIGGATSACCGGPAPAATDACCALDAEAKAAGQAGCGGSDAASPTPARLVATGTPAS